ncbi:MAG: FMN-binding protein [Chloroflexota bacterium]
MQPNEGFFKKYYPIIVVVIVVFCSVFLLSFVNRFAEVKIREQEDAASLAPLKVIFSGMSNFRLENDIYVILDGNGNTIGYAFKAMGTGYGGDISIMVALEDANTVKGIAIVSQSETPGLGSRITLPAFAEKFVGKKIENIKLTADGGEIDAITGSTVSSRAVVDAIRNTALEKVKALPE